MDSSHRPRHRRVVVTAIHQIGNPQRQTIEDHDVSIAIEGFKDAANLQRHFNGLEGGGAIGAMAFDPQRHLVIEGLRSGNKELAATRIFHRERNRVGTFAAARAAGNQRQSTHHP